MASAPRLFGVEPPKPRIEAVRIVDMSASECLGGICRRSLPAPAAHLEHEQAKAELKSLVPEDAKEAIGHGVRAKRSKSGAISFDLLGMEDGSHAAVQSIDRQPGGGAWPRPKANSSTRRSR